VAVVTGAGMGIGRELALALAHEGADVAILDVDAGAGEDAARAIRAVGRRSVAAQVDVRDGEGVKRAVEAAKQEIGPADILINNAGVGHEEVSFVDLPPSSWERVLGVCVYGTLHVSQAVLPLMLARKSGRIVNITSELAITGGARAAIYATAKAAVQGFTRSLARDVAPSRITVNAVSPGDVDTERSIAHEAEVEKTMSRADADARRRQRATMFPLGRPGRPSDVAAAVLFFCSDEASYVTGQTLLVNGGSTMV